MFGLRSGSIRADAERTVLAAARPSCVDVGIYYLTIQCECNTGHENSSRRFPLDVKRVLGGGG